MIVIAKVVSSCLIKSVVIVVLFVACTLPSIASKGGGFDNAKNLYKQKQFTQASNLFQKLIDGGDERPIVYLYLGHSLYMMNSRAKAIQAYKKIVEKFPGTGEARVASGALRKFGVSSSAKTKMSSGNQPSNASLLKRIRIIPPRFGHPRVSQNTIKIVRGTIANLPKRMYRILDEGGAKLYIGSNMIDQWPDSLNGRHPADGHLYCNEPGRTYDLDMYIFERPLARDGHTDLGRAWDDKVIRLSVYVQCAHALDYLMEHLSNDVDFQKFYNQDLKSIPPGLAARLPVESAGTHNARIQTFSEIMVSEMGLDTPKGSMMKRAFPRTRMFIKDSIKRIKLKKWKN